MGSNFRNYINTFVFDTELPGSGLHVSFRPVTTGQIKKLLLYETSQDPLSIETALDELIEECVIKPEGFKVKDLYIQDRFYLMVEIRKATRGSSYSFQTICASCGSQTQQNINLTNLLVTKLTKGNKSVETKKVSLPSTIKPKKNKLVEKTDENPDEKPEIITKQETNEWDVVKINDNISVRLTLVTRALQQEAFDLFKANHPNVDNVSDIEKTLDITTLLYALSIKSIITPEGEESDVPLEEKVFLLDNIRQEEQEKISKWYDKNDFGIDFSFDVPCTHCGYKEKKAVPVESFFY